MIMIMAFKSVSHHNWDCSGPIPEKFSVSKVDAFLDDDGDGDGDTKSDINSDSEADGDGDGDVVGDGNTVST